MEAEDLIRQAKRDGRLISFNRVDENEVVIGGARGIRILDVDERGFAFIAWYVSDELLEDMMSHPLGAKIGGCDYASVRALAFDLEAEDARARSEA